MGREDKTDLRSTNPPSKEKFMLFQPNNPDLIQFIRGCHKFNFWESPTIHIPK